MYECLPEFPQLEVLPGNTEHCKGESFLLTYQNNFAPRQHHDNIDIR